jgi:tetratricopeptide (TPR) repeat protein
VDRFENLRAISNPYQQGSFLLAQWRAFLLFVQPGREVFYDVFFAFRQAVFSLALQSFTAIGSETADYDLYLQMGRCRKGKGDYDEAIPCLEAAYKCARENAEVIAELADAYALVDENRMAKALFREAFFIDPQRVDLDFLQSFLILGLVEKVRGLGYVDEELLEWVSVYGVLSGVFSVKRELKPIELGKLNQSIYQLENALKMSEQGRALIIPRLLNRYFWLVDHLVATNATPESVKEVLLKINLLDQRVYRLYTA